MADIFTPEKRSQIMSRIRNRDTKPELAVRSMLHRFGYRFTVNGPKNSSLPGRPDIVHRSAKIPDRDLCSWLLLAWP
jgi:DNA mismatch endonuclease (patch repair protein)